MSTLKRRALLLLLIVGALCAGLVAIQRLRLERPNRTVALAVDYAEVQNLAELSGLTVPEALQRLRQVGVTHVGLTEWSLEEMVRSLPYPTPRLLPDNVAWQLKHKLPESRITTDYAGGDMVRVASALAAAAARMPEMGVGYDYEAAAAIRDAGLQVIARPRPDFTVTAQALGVSLDGAKAIRAKIVIFNGTQVLGNGGLLAQTASALDARGLTYGYVELVPQEGESELARRLGYRLLRVHSISEAEMAERMTPSTALDRYSLAVRERKVRICYVRLFFDQGENPLTANLEYLAALAERLRREGFALGEPVLYAAPTPHRSLRIGLYLGIGAALLWLAQLFLGLSVPWFWGLFLLMVADAVVEGFLGHRSSGALAALTAGVVFPAWGIVALHRPEQAAPRPVWRAVRAFAAISGLTLLGALLAAGPVTTQSYLLGLEQFRGVKLQQTIPLLLVLAVMLARFMPRYRDARLELGEHRGEIWALREGLADALGYAVRYWQALLIMFGLAAVGLLLIRSGNEPPIAASGLERQFRALLDHLLWVRPRTKEIFFGHPLLVLSLILLFRGSGRGVWLGLTAGAVGQVSLLNTFCHLHTPLTVALVRAFHGLWIGLLMGLILWLAVAWVERRLYRVAQPSASPEEESDWTDWEEGP